MEDNEDEPEDVKKATPVADEIESGRKDEKAGNAKGTRSEKKDANKSSRCEKDAKKPILAKSEADCCRSKITKSSKTSKMMSVMVYSPPCTLPRLEIIPRHCLSKQEYIDVLATPSRKCPPECFGKTVVRKIRPISARINELAQPARRLIFGTLKERGETLPPEMISNLVKSIEGSACMTPEQAEKYFRDKEREKERRVGKTHGRQKCKGKSKRDQCSSQLDKEAVMCQYLMAERFVKSILRWKCPIPVEEFQDIASVILRRLSFVLEYTPIDGQDLKSQQMRFLADIIACWISGVLFEVAEEHKKEIEEELIAREEEEEDEDEEDEEDVEEVEETKEPVEETDDDEEEKDKEEDLIRPKKEKEDGGNADVVQENSVVIKSEPTDEDSAKRERAEKEAKDREQERLAADKKKTEEQEEEWARKEAEEKVKMESEEEDKRKNEAEAEEKKLREEKEEEEEKKRKKKQEEEEEENRSRIEADEKKKKEQEVEEAEENRKKKELEEEEEKRKKKLDEEEEEKRMKKEQEKEEEKRKKKEQEEEEEKRMKKEQEEEEERRMKKEQEEEEEKIMKKEQEEAKEKRMEKDQAEEEEKRKRQEQKKAEEDRKKKIAEDQKKEKQEEEAELKRMGPKKAIEGIGDGELFETDLPFVTFGKILDTVYKMLEEEPEGDETDIIHNRIQRSLYEKFARLIELEAPDSLTENLKDVVDVFAGKAATWVRRLLKDSELEFMNDNPAEVESKEIRDWGKWIDQVTDRAGDWADWIHRVVNEAEEKSATIVQRGDWQNWTSDTETNALLWRRYYLETIHQAHHNKMMIVDRPVVKTRLSAVEEEIRNTDLAA